jgi:hypothetical protein
MVSITSQTKTYVQLYISMGSVELECFISRFTSTTITTELVIYF